MTMSTVEATDGPRTALAPSVDWPGADSRLIAREDNSNVDAPMATLGQTE